MSKLKMLQPRISLLDTSRVRPMPRPSRSADYRKRGRAGVADRERIRQRDNGLCQACLDRNVVTIGTQVDHILALHKGGPDTDANKRLLCDECHRVKGIEDLKP
jgi:5-methylcytosine-specific restriction protein A